MDFAAFALATVATTVTLRRYKKQPKSVSDNDNDDDGDGDNSLFYVTSENEPIDADPDGLVGNLWHRTTYVLIMHDPPDMFYEPKEWSHTTVLLCKIKGNDETEKLALPCGSLRRGETHVSCGQRILRQRTGVDVTLPENCLHHLFTFPYDGARDGVKQWADFMECVFRGSMADLKHQGQDLVRLSLDELKENVSESPDSFSTESYYAIRLYFQRQMDLRAKRRLLKGYSSIDMEKYGLRTEQKPIVFKADEEDSERGGALDYTMKTDDGMSPRLLMQADVVLLGVSRAGKRERFRACQLFCSVELTERKIQIIR